VIIPACDHRNAVADTIAAGQSYVDCISVVGDWTIQNEVTIEEASGDIRQVTCLQKRADTKRGTR
jgi:hypothetical protein